MRAIVAPLRHLPVPQRERHRLALLGVVAERHRWRRTGCRRCSRRPCRARSPRASAPSRARARRRTSRCRRRSRARRACAVAVGSAHAGKLATARVDVGIELEDAGEAAHLQHLVHRRHARRRAGSRRRRRAPASPWRAGRAARRCSCSSRRSGRRSDACCPRRSAAAASAMSVSAVRPSTLPVIRTTVAGRAARRRCPLRALVFGQSEASRLTSVRRLPRGMAALVPYLVHHAG